MRKIIFSLITLLSCFAHGQLANLPDVAGLTHVGRLTVFKSVQPLSWMMPTAFSSEMDCTNNLSGDKRTCTVRIYNRLDPKEQNQIDQMLNIENLGLVFFSDVDSQVVKNIEEKFEQLPPDIEGKSLSLKTMALSAGSFSYGSWMFRVKKDRAQELLDSYQNKGVGRFVISFDLNTQNTEMYLALKNGSCLKNKLLATSGQKLSKTEMMSLLSEATSQCEMSAVAFDANEARQYLSYNLRSSFFVYRKGHYQLNDDKVNQIGNRYVLHNDVGDIELAHCQVELNLKKDSLPETHCQFSDGSSL